LAHISVELSRHDRHWLLKINVDSKVESTRVIGCSDGMTPLIAGLLAAEAEEAALRSTTDGHSLARPSRISVTMPSKRVLTFELGSLDETLAKLPESSL
jgi:hypothetical protein